MGQRSGQRLAQPAFAPFGIDQFDLGAGQHWCRSDQIEPGPVGGPDGLAERQPVDEHVEIERSTASLSMPSDEVALPWGSASMRRTAIAALGERNGELTAVVVFPTPPF